MLFRIYFCSSGEIQSKLALIRSAAESETGT